MYRIELDNKIYEGNSIHDIIGPDDIISIDDGCGKEVFVHIIDKYYLNQLLSKIPGMTINKITGIYKKSGKDFIKIMERVNNELQVIDHASR